MERLYKVIIHKEGKPTVVFYSSTYQDALNIEKQFTGYMGTDSSELSSTQIRIESITLWKDLFSGGSYIIKEGEFYAKSK